MVRRPAILLCALLLASCGPQVIGSDPSGGVVTNVDSIAHRADAVRAATLYCRNFGKTAQPTALDPYTNIMKFDCV